MNNMKFRRTAAIILVGLVVILIGRLSSAGEGGKLWPLRIIHVNDTHSHLEPTILRIKLNGADTRVSAGGYPRFISQAGKWQKEAANSLILHAGDLVQGTLYFNKYKGRADMELMNLLPPAAMVVGNHEFDHGPALLADIIKMARFPVLGLNVDAGREPYLKGLIQPYVVKTFDGEKVVIVGLVTAETPQISSPGKNLVFLEAVSALKSFMAQDLPPGVNKVIVLSHLGYRQDLALAKAVPGIDLIVGGHSHTLLGDFSALGLVSSGPYPTRVEGPDGAATYVVQAWEHTKVAGILNLGFDREGVVKACQGRAVLLIGEAFEQKKEDWLEVNGSRREDILKFIAATPCVEVVKEDAQALVRLAEFKPGIEALKATKVAVVAENLLQIRAPGRHPSGVNLPHGSPIVQIVADSLLWKADQLGLKVDLALLNAGAVRVDLPQGDLTVAKVYELMPFSNTMFLLKLKGQEIKEALEQGLARGEGAFPYVAGARYSADMSRPQGDWVTFLEIRQPDGAWTGMVRENMYSVAVNSFMAGGGDGYTVLKNAAEYRYDSGFIDEDIFMDYARHLGILKIPVQMGLVSYKPGP